MRTARVAFLVLAAALGIAPQGSAQGLNYALFERYLESLRQQSAIPGMSAAIVQDGRIVWSKGLGKANLEGNVDPTVDTPYVVNSASEVFGATLLLEKCADTGLLDIGDRVVRWNPAFADPVSRLSNLLTHATAAGTFHYDPARYSALTQVVEQCTTVPYKKLLANELILRFQLHDSAPGQALATPTLEDQHLFDSATLAAYAAVISRMAVPYRVDASGNATRSDFAGEPLDASGGVITSVADLASFDKALTIDDSLLLPGTLISSFTAATAGGAPLPTGLGWFVQSYNGVQVVWQFGMVKDAYSSLILKLPKYRVTLILLANSDGLTAPFGLENGDVTASPFAKLFFRIFGI